MGLKDMVIKEARPLPVMLLIDDSGSMRDEKIETVNVAVREMLHTFSNLSGTKGQIKVCIIAFGNEMRVVQEFKNVDEIVHPVLTANGKTWMGQAICKAIDILDDRDIVPSRAYTPTIVMISDGLPTDCPKDLNYVYKAWEPLQRLHNSTRLAKCPKLALGIGNDADYNMLKTFINNEKIPVIKAQDISTIAKFFSWATFTVSRRSVSSNPDEFDCSGYLERFNDYELVF